MKLPRRQLQYDPHAGRLALTWDHPETIRSRLVHRANSPAIPYFGQPARLCDSLQE